MVEIQAVQMSLFMCFSLIPSIVISICTHFSEKVVVVSERNRNFVPHSAKNADIFAHFFLKLELRNGEE